MFLTAALRHNRAYSYEDGGELWNILGYHRNVWGKFCLLGRFFNFSLSTEAQLQEQPGESGARQHHQEEDLLAQLSPAQPQLREGGEAGAAAEAAG